MRSKKKKAVTNRLMILAFSVAPLFAAAQQSDTAATAHRARLNTFIIGSAAAYGATLGGLYQLWYKDSKQQPFQFFNDNAEWMQVDKLGHFYASFYFSYGTAKALRWCRIPPAKSDLAGAITGFALLVPIEIFDGFSDAYGASAGDLLADAAGASFFLVQTKLWNEIRLRPKFSFHQTHYAAQRPGVLGNGMPSEILKDYNGQTYWLSADMDKFIKFPRWLNIAVGYGANGMIYARDAQNHEAGYPYPYRQLYITIDPDLSAIKTRSKILNTCIFLANMIKLPAPTLEFSRHGTKFHAFYF